CGSASTPATITIGASRTTVERTNLCISIGVLPDASDSPRYDKHNPAKIKIEFRSRPGAGGRPAYGFGIRSVALIIALPLRPNNTTIGWSTAGPSCQAPSQR